MPEERKLVTILFADVTGSTALGDSLDPEDVRALMSRYYEHARRLIPAYGGTLEKFIGDAVMAVFGLPQAHGDDAERALAAALALRDAIAGDEVLGAAAFRLRIGVNTGEVVATSNPAGGDFLVTGDAVNVAARLQQGANPGEIIAGERTALAAQTAFLFEEPRELQAKGKPKPLRVFPLKGPRTARKVERPPFVGRRQDLLQLSLLQARTLEEKRPQLVSVVAPAGTGKSRLLEEFLQRLDPEDGFQVAFARCLPYGQTLTYWPLRGLLAELLGGEPEKARLSAAFQSGGYAQEDSARLAELVLTTLGIEGEGTGDRESIFAAWRLLIEVLAQQAPRIIVFEDLHWASESLLDLVEHIIHLRTHAALLLVALSRPELLDRRPTWGGGRQNFTALALQPLGEAQTRELLARSSDVIPENLREQIAERSGGNPFFALEMLHALAERGQQGKELSSATLPDTVHAAVLARIDLLSQEERTVLQVASVASRSFRTPMLQAVLEEYSEQEIEAALDGLLARDLIVPIDNQSYGFRHILIRDVAYNMLSRSERIRLHSKIAVWQEAMAKEKLDEYVELIAYHYREALHLARQSAVRPALPFKMEDAARILERAGLLASRSGTFAEAHSQLQLAIELAPASEHVRLYELLGDSVLWGGTRREAYSKALEKWREAGEQDPLTGARLMRKVLISGTRTSFLNRMQESEINELRREALSLAEAAGDEDEIWRIRVTECFRPGGIETIAEFKRSEVQHAHLKELALQAADYFEQHGNWEAMSEALDGYASLSLLAVPQDALRASQRRLSIPDLPPSEWADAINMVMASYFYMGDFERELALARDTFAQLKPGQPIASLGGVAALACGSAFIGGHWEEIDHFLPYLDEIRELVQYDQLTSVRLFEGYLVILMVALAREDQVQINALSALAYQLTRPIASIHQCIDALLADDAEREIELDFRDTTNSLVTVVVPFLNEHGVVAPELMLQIIDELLWVNPYARYTGAIATALRDNDNARLAQAIDEAEAHHLVVHAARMRIVLAQRTNDPAPLERARPVLERLGDRQFLRRLEEVASLLASR